MDDHSDREEELARSYEFLERSKDEQPMIVERVLGRKFSHHDDDDDGSGVSEMYLIKWRGLSYIHVSWEVREDIENVDPHGKMKLKQFLEGPPSPQVVGKPFKIENDEDYNIDEEDIEYFSSDFVEVHRIISCDTPDCRHSKCLCIDDMDFSADNPNNVDLNVMYFVKWRGLPYDECTWEYWTDIRYFTKEVFEFWLRQRPPVLPSSTIKHPPVQEYLHLAESPAFGAYGSLHPEGGLKLRKHHLEGVNWLLWNWWHKRPSILADEAGLAKMIQSICFIHLLSNMSSTRCQGPYLVVTQLSQLDQWQNEIALWSPNTNCVVMHGSQKAKEVALAHEFFYNEPFTPKSDVIVLKNKNACKFHIMLTTYDVCLRDIKVFANIDWKVMIVDEAHRLKNQHSHVYEALKTIPRQHCVLLTGTPLQNSTEEIWSLLHFADPSEFSDFPEFVKKFGDLKGTIDVSKVHSFLIDENVEKKDFPPKEEVIVEVALTSFQRQLYRAIYKKNVPCLLQGLKLSNVPSLMNVVRELQKCCNHPYLIRGLEERLIGENPSKELTSANLGRELVEYSGKFVLLDKLLPKLKAEGRKVLIFSQMVKVLNLLEELLRSQNYRYERLDGAAKSTDRSAAVERFCRPSMNRLVMLLSSRAGNLGLNLTAADTVIMFDSDWNPHNDMQAQARAHHIGQTKAVKVYRLLSRKTFEMYLFHQISLKLGADKGTLTQSRSDHEDERNNSIAGESSSFQAKEMEGLLKQGACNICRDDDTDFEEFSNADIDVILENRTHIVCLDDFGEASSSNSSRGFSKPSFMSAEKSGEDIVDTNDPDFWKKVLGCVEQPGEEDLPLQTELQKKRLLDVDYQDVELEEMLLVQKIETKQPASPLEKDHKLHITKRKDHKASTGPPHKRKKTKTRDIEEHKDVKLWGAHARDRVLRALMQFGFGRWKLIRSESGATHRTFNDIEEFSRSYVLQCGLCAADEMERKNFSSNDAKKSNKKANSSSSKFIDDAINAAKQIENLDKKGEIKMSQLIPSILQEDKFVLKLKDGLSRKVLNRLDHLAKLNSMIQHAVESYTKSTKTILHQKGDIDSIVAQIANLKDLSRHLTLPIIRPAWARLRSWWNEECDRYLLIGLFVHGYGKYSEIRDDPSFSFQANMKQAALRAKTAAASIDSKYKSSLIELADKTLRMSTSTRNDKCQDAIDEEVIVDDLVVSKENWCRLSIASIRHSSYRGVYSQPGSTKWMAQYGNNMRSTYLGTFDTEVEAALAYDRFAKDAEETEKGCNFISNGLDGPDLKLVRQQSVTALPKQVSPPLPWHRASLYRGVRASGAKWTAQIFFDGVNHHLGTFSSEYQAVLAYDQAARERHGEAAVLNFPRGIEEELSTLEGVDGIEVQFCYRSTNPRTELSEENSPRLQAQTDSSRGDLVDEKRWRDLRHHEKNTNGFKRKDIARNENNASLKISAVDENINGQHVNCPSKARLDAKERSLLSSELPHGEQDKNEQGREQTNHEGGNIEDKSHAEKANSNAKKRGQKKLPSKLSGMSPEEEQMRADMLMPEPKALNRLFAWLVTQDDTKESKNKVVESDVRPFRSKSNAKKRKKGEYCERKKHLAIKAVKKFLLATSPIPIESSFNSKKPELLAEDEILVMHHDIFASGSQNFPQWRLLLQKCESILQASDRCKGNSFDSNVIESSRPSTSTDGNVVECMEESNRLCLAFLIFGAPIEDSYYPVSCSDVCALLGTYSLDSQSAPLSSLSWDEIVDLAGLRCSSRRAKAIYSKYWLPFCVNIASTEKFSCRNLLPDLAYDVSEHSPATKALCSLFMQRQRMLYSIKLLLSKHSSELQKHLKLQSGSYTAGMPVWWCPWIHDIALMVGCLKHGFLNLERIRRDKQSPLWRENLEQYIYRVFVYGSLTQAPAAAGVFSSVDEVQSWVQCVSSEIPHKYDIELRLCYMLAELTKNLPRRHLCRIYHGKEGLSIAGSDSGRKLMSRCDPSPSVQDVHNIGGTE